MAGDWIKMRGNLWDDPRIARLCDLCDCGEASIVGALYWLWATADQHTENGIMPGLTCKAIDRKVGVLGFSDALCKIGWLHDHPEGVRIANFEEHNGSSAKRRSLDAQRKANVRSLSASQADKIRTDDGQKTPNLGAREEKRREEISITNVIDKKRSRANVLQKPESVSQQTWDDFLVIRKAKKAPLSQTALDGIAKEADKAGLSLQQALENCCIRGWQGFRAEWLKNANNQTNKNPMSQMTWEERDRIAGMQRWEEMTNRRHPELPQEYSKLASSNMEFLDVEASFLELGNDKHH